jgi:hypothetical protein
VAFLPFYTRTSWRQAAPQELPPTVPDKCGLQGLYGNLDGETTRLARALSPEIGTPQSTFLIDDNICTVQFVIARSKIRNEKLGVLFLDLEKAYDRSATILCGG